MLFMVIERFKSGGARAVGERFRSQDRMLPEGVTYVSSWMEASGASCFQVMEASSRNALGPWIDHWKDLVEFEIVPVLSSSDFWARFQQNGSSS